MGSIVPNFEVKFCLKTCQLWCGTDTMVINSPSLHLIGVGLGISGKLGGGWVWGLEFVWDGVIDWVKCEVDRVCVWLLFSAVQRVCVCVLGRCLEVQSMCV